ncbi:sensor histidine kinase, partial [Kitasatospora sp. NPDC018614]
MTTTGEEHPTALTGPWWWTRWRSALFDGSLALVSAAECAVEGVPFARDAGIPLSAGLVFGLLAGSVLLIRRRWPIAVVLVAIAVTPAQMGFLMG